MEESAGACSVCGHDIDTAGCDCDRPEEEPLTEPNAFERFILHNRIYCEHEGCRFKLTPAIRVLSLYKNPKAVCEFHAGLGEKETQSEATIQGQMAVQEPSDAPLPSPWTEEEFTEFANQEPLPPNQSFQLPAEEQPIKESEEYAEH